MSARKQPVSPQAHASARQPSALVRTLKAKLQVLKRPAVWGSLLLLLLPLIFLASYWNTLNQVPETADARPNLPSLDPALAPEATSPEAALPALLQPDLLDALAQPQTPQPSPQAKPANKPQPAASAVAVPALPSLGSSASSASSKANSESGAAADSAQPVTLSPLQSALDRSTGQNSAEASSSNRATSADVTSADATSAQTPVTRIYEFGSSTGQAAGGQAAGQTGQTSGGQSPTGLPYPTYVPQTSPAAGTTGYTLPPALRAPVNVAPLPIGPSQLPAGLPNGSTPPLGTGYSAPVPAPTVIAPQPQAPFSVPRVPPGRYIGNGEINTFSNP